LIGDFKQAGQTWSLEPIAVNVHDFLGDSLGRAVPYGIYDMLNNRGTVYVGNSADTPAFAVAPHGPLGTCAVGPPGHRPAARLAARPRPTLTTPVVTKHNTGLTASRHR